MMKQKRKVKGWSWTRKRFASRRTTRKVNIKGWLWTRKKLAIRKHWRSIAMERKRRIQFERAHHSLLIDRAINLIRVDEKQLFKQLCNDLRKAFTAKKAAKAIMNYRLDKNGVIARRVGGLHVKFKQCASMSKAQADRKLNQLIDGSRNVGFTSGEYLRYVQQ